MIHRPAWEEVAILSGATKRLWSMFENLHMCDGVLQRGWKELATGETRWKVVVLRALRKGPLGSPRHSTTSDRSFSRANTSGMCKTITATVTAALPGRAQKTDLMPSSNNFLQGSPWREWGFMSLGCFPKQRGITATSPLPWTISLSGPMHTAWPQL